MKLTIDQKVLGKLLEKGALAALSDEAQGDTTTFSRLIKAVKLTVTKDTITAESATSLIASKHVLNITKDSGISVKEEGSALIPALELINWVEKQRKAQISLSLSLLATPQVISVVDDQAELSNSKGAVKKIANLKLASRDESKTGSKWQVDCYDPSPITPIDFSKRPKKCISIPSKQLKDGLTNVVFSSQPKDYQHIFDSIALEAYKGDVYMAASDMHRCSIYKLNEASSVDNDFFTETKSEGGSVVYGQKILIPCAFLKIISKNSDESQVVDVHYDKEKNKVYIHEEGWDLRLATVDENMFKKFPTVHMLLSKTFSRLGNVPKGILSSRLTSASLVNKHQVLFDFQNDSVVIHAISEDGKSSPNQSNAPVRQLSKDAKVVLGVQHFLDVIKVIKDDDISMLVPDNMRSLKVVSAEDPNLSYYAMTINNPKYAELMK
jgi:DNA polymerase III sliding clamp (beta) subunit (PCNA family)